MKGYPGWQNDYFDYEPPEEPHPPCAICGGENDQGEVCAECAKTYDPYPDLEGGGGWAVQDGRSR
jgi:hypothetical protein